MRSTEQTSMKADALAAQHVAQMSVTLRVQARLDNCPYRYYFNRITWHYAHGTLRLAGIVPTST